MASSLNDSPLLLIPILATLFTATSEHRSASSGNTASVRHNHPQQDWDKVRPVQSTPAGTHRTPRRLDQEWAKKLSSRNLGLKTPTEFGKQR